MDTLEIGIRHKRTNLTIIERVFFFEPCWVWGKTWGEAELNFLKQFSFWGEREGKGRGGKSCQSGNKGNPERISANPSGRRPFSFVLRRRMKKGENPSFPAHLLPSPLLPSPPFSILEKKDGANLSAGLSRILYYRHTHTHTHTRQSLWEEYMSSSTSSIKPISIILPLYVVCQGHLAPCKATLYSGSSPCVQKNTKVERPVM